MGIKSCPCFWHIANFMMSRHSANRRVILFCSAYSLMNRLFFFAQMADKVVGLTQLYPLFCSLEMKRIWLLYDFFVDPSSRKQGVAEALIARAGQLAKESDPAFIMLSTATDNTQALYEKNGFVRDTDFYVYNKMLNK